MSQRRPPDDEPTLDEPEGTRADGLRSQTRPAQSGSPQPAGRGAQGDWGKTRPLDAEAFGTRPTPMRPEPARAFVRGEAADEATVRVARAVFTGAKPGTVDDPPAAAPGAQGATDRTHLLGSAAEPLRVPSNRPPPSPYKTGRGANAKATLLMNDTPAGAPRNPAPEPAARPQSPRAPAPSPVSAGRQPPATLPVDQAQMPAPAAAAPAAKGKGQPPPSRASAAPSAPTGDSEPLRLQLHEGDVLEQPVDVGAPDGVPGRSPMLTIVLVVLALLGAGAGLWYGMSGSKPAAELPPSRNDLQPATPGTAVPAEAPAQPPTAVPAAAPVAPAQPAGAAAAPAGAQPSAVQPAEPARAGPSETKPAAQPAREAAKKPARAKRRGSASSDTLGPPPNDDVAAAREALRNLQSGGPVMRVQPTEEPAEEESSGPIAPPEPPAPPPPPPPPEP